MFFDRVVERLARSTLDQLSGQGRVAEQAQYCRSQYRQIARRYQQAVDPIVDDVQRPSLVRAVGLRVWDKTS